MACLKKVYIARFFGKDGRRPFHSDKLVADSFIQAEEIALEWGTKKYNGRLMRVEVERSKGEVISA